MRTKIDPNHLVWKSEYNIGDFKTDNEHQTMFKIAKKALLIRKLHDNEEKEIKELKEIITSLYNYTALHFKNEEKYMYRIQYPDLQRHQQIHVSLLNVLNNFVKSINTLTIDEIEDQLYVFVESYFIKHIVDEDKLIGAWSTSLERLRKFSQWKESYKIGHPQIDAQHQKLFEIANEAFQEVSPSQRDQKNKETMKHLYEYMKEHFKDEEAFMKEINYPQYEEHKQLHKEIINDCNELLQDINNMDAEVFEKELAKTIDRHLIKHVIEDDNKIMYWYTKECCK